MTIQTGNAVRAIAGQHAGVEGEVSEVNGQWLLVVSGEGEFRIRAKHAVLVEADEAPELPEGEVTNEDLEAAGLAHGTNDDEAEAEAEEDDEPASNLARQMRKYRAGYQPGVNASGSKTLTNADQLAIAMLRLHPAGTCAAADALFEQPAGHHAARYAALNPGQQRMNSGNRIRAGVRKGTFTLEQALEAIDAAAASPVNVPAAA